MSKDLLFNLQSKVKEKGIVDDDLINYIDSIFPNKSEKVLEVIKRGIIKNIYKPSNRIVWTAIGENCEHLIYPNLYCSCQDFYKSVVVKRKRDFCKHILAQLICEVLESFKQVELEDGEFKSLINDLESKF